MPANAKWPDFQLASKLRYFMGSSAPDSTQSETTSSQLDQAKREELLLSAREIDQDLGGETHTATMADIDNDPVEEMEDVVGDYGDEGGPADVDVDFGDLEMFDSNASQLPFSSQAPQSLKYEEPEFPASSGSAKREKSSKKKSKAPDFAVDDEPPNAATSKRKKSKKKALQHSDIAEDQSTDANPNSASAPLAAEDDERGPDALEDATTEMDALDLKPDQAVQKKKKKKRKPSDSVDGKRNKKRKGVEDDNATVFQHSQDETENLEGRGTATNFLPAASPQLGTTVDDDVANADEQISPSIARARRRSQTGEETRSRENSVPFRAQVAPMAPMAIDTLPQEEVSNHVDDRDDEEELNIARQVWKEHKSSEIETVKGANEADIDQNATGVNGSGDSAQAEEQPTESPARRRSTRTKAKPLLLVQAMESKAQTPSKRNRQALRELPSPSANTPKPRKRSKRATKKQPQQPLQPLEEYAENAEYQEPSARTGDSGDYTKGRFTEAEFDSIARVIEQFRNEYGISQAEVNEIIQTPGGTTAGDAHASLWYRLFEVCPDRKRQKVINVARKKYHNFVARGTWTLEQDEELSQLFEVHANKWSKIAGLIKRHPEDVRDRYRNYIVCGPHQRKDVWSEDEENQLTQVVEEAMDVLKELRQEDPGRPIYQKNLEDIIDWQNISLSMGRKRSRLQCITKWKAMQNRRSGNKKDKKPAPAKTSERKRRSEPAEVLISDEDISSHLDSARQQLASMREEEQYRLVLAIQQASVLSDADIPWAKLLDKKFRGQWTLGTQVLLWDRLKQTVTDWETLTVLDIAQYIINEYNRTGGLPEINGSGYDDDEREKEILQQLRSRSRPAPPPPKSAEFVEDSGGEDTREDGQADGNDKADITIDPALMEVPPPSPPKATPKPKKKTSAKRKSKKASLSQDPIEDSGPTVPSAAVYDVEESDLEEAPTPMVKIPGTFRSVNNNQEEEAVAALRAEPYSDSDMDDMEDLPAKILA